MAQRNGKQAGGETAPAQIDVPPIVLTPRTSKVPAQDSEYLTTA